MQRSPRDRENLLRFPDSAPSMWLVGHEPPIYDGRFCSLPSRKGFTDCIEPLHCTDRHWVAVGIGRDLGLAQLATWKDLAAVIVECELPAVSYSVSMRIAAVREFPPPIALWEMTLDNSRDEKLAAAIAPMMPIMQNDSSKIAHSRKRTCDWRAICR